MKQYKNIKLIKVNKYLHNLEFLDNNKKIIVNLKNSDNVDTLDFLVNNYFDISINNDNYLDQLTKRYE